MVTRGQEAYISGASIAGDTADIMHLLFCRLLTLVLPFSLLGQAYLPPLFPLLPGPVLLPTHRAALAPSPQLSGKVAWTVLGLGVG